MERSASIPAWVARRGWNRNNPAWVRRWLKRRPKPGRVDRPRVEAEAPSAQILPFARVVDRA